MAIRKLREAEGLTQEQLAQRAKVSQAYLSRLEAGQRKAPTIRIAQRLAKALGVPVAALLE